MSEPGAVPLAGLFAEAERQLTICNACRYCEGYCAVFPALERRRDLTDGDITHLADLCHDCRDCYTACMYAPPHEFALNLPAALSAVRRQTYDDYLPRVPWPRTRRGAMLAAALAAVAILALVGGAVGGAGAPAGSPYRVIAYPALLVVFGLAAAWSVIVMALSAARYRRATNGRGLASPAAVGAAVRQAATLRNLRGGGADCSYPGDEPSAARRRLHGFVAWGFVACVASTVAAAISQDFAGDPPPYPVLSAPVLFGIAGGAGLVIGCAGLLVLRRTDLRLTRDDPAREDLALARRGYALLAGLLLLAVSGLLTLVVRDTAAFGPVLVVHLAAVAACFAIAPYTKFMHVVYKFLALVHDSAESPQKIAGGTGRNAALRLRCGRHNGGQIRAASRWVGRCPAARARRP